MNLMNFFMPNYTPMEIAQMIYFGEFNPNNEYFQIQCLREFRVC
jgi:hypothetical protein